MQKTLTYSSFAIAGVLVTVVFLTAKTYTQLAVASLLYVPLAFFAYNLFMKRTRLPDQPQVSLQKAQEPARKEPEKIERAEVADMDKRVFLKLIGAAGVTFFLSSLLGKGVENILFQGEQATSGSSQTYGLTADNYRISEIDESENAFYGFVNPSGNWFIMKEDPINGTFRYTKGDSDLSSNWARRGELKYDYFHELF